MMKARILSSCAGATILALSSLVGSSALARPTLGDGDLARLSDVTASTAYGHESVTNEQRDAWNQSKADLWAQLFEKPLDDSELPVISLDHRPDSEGVIGGANLEGDAVHLLAFEVTPLNTDDESVRGAVGEQRFNQFKEAKADATLIFGFLMSPKGSRAVLGVSSTYISENGLPDTVFIPMVVASRATSISTCPIQAEEAFESISAGGVDEIRNGGTWGYCRCVGQVLKCELYTAGCIAAAPACVITCAEVCAGTLGLGCVACITACTAGAVALCETALNCWRTACNKGCVPC